jgi:hypothetical protein
VLSSKLITKICISIFKRFLIFALFIICFNVNLEFELCREKEESIYYKGKMSKDRFLYVKS